ncbi:DUF433 domain-containing protein [Candidatus Poribacteria bacterium]|nr:DUF433 domain-containing protein [Candidatus Poribacteria bacterium]
MELENMFEIINPTAIRIKGTRVGIEIVIEQFLNGADPREIQRLYPNLTLEQIYATITYYLFNKKKIDVYIAEGIKQAEAAYEEQLTNPSPGVKRLMKIKAELEAQGYYSE